MAEYMEYINSRTIIGLIVICLSIEHLGVLKNLLKRVRALQTELEFGNVVFKERGTPEYPEKNLSEQRREPTTNSTHIGVHARIRTRGAH